MTTLVSDSEHTATQPEITCEQEDLVAALSALVKFVPTRPQYPSLVGVRCVYEPAEDTLTLQTTDGMISAEVVLGPVGYDGHEVQEGQHIEFVIPAKLALQILDAYPDGSVTFEVHDAQVYLVSGKLRYKVVTLDASSFPHIDIGHTFDWSTVYPAEAGTILGGLQYAARAATKDNNKPNLQGVRVTIDQQWNASFFATDTKHMLETTIPLGGGFNLAAMTIPAPVIEAMGSMLEPTDRIKIVAHPNGYWICRNDMSVRIGVRAAAQKYPDVTPILQLPQDKAVVVDRELLEGTLKRMKAFIDSTHQKVIVKFDGLFMTLEVKSGEGEADEQLFVKAWQPDPNEQAWEMIPEDWEIGLRLTALYDAIASINSDQIVFRMTDLRSPALIQSIDPQVRARYITALIR